MEVRQLKNTATVRNCRILCNKKHAKIRLDMLDLV